MTAGTRTAPTVNGTPTYKVLSFHLIDASGDKATASWRVPNTVIASEIETAVAAYQAVTQASVYKVTVADTYNSVEDAGNAQNDERMSVYDRLGVLVRDATAMADNLPILAPEPATMLGDADEIDPDNATTLPAWFTAGLALLNGGAGGSGTFGVISARYSERSEMNKAVAI